MSLTAEYLTVIRAGSADRGSADRRAIRSASGFRVLVRTPKAARLADLLSALEVNIDSQLPGQLDVTGLNAREVPMPLSTNLLTGRYLFVVFVAVSGNVTPVSSSETGHSRRPTVWSRAALERPTSFGARAPAGSRSGRRSCARDVRDRRVERGQALLDAFAEAGFARLDTELRAALATAGEEFGSRLHAMAAAYLWFATEDAALLELMFTGKHREGADWLVAAAAAPFGLMHDVIAQGQAQGVLEPGDPQRVGIVLFATLQGIASLINGSLGVPELLDGIMETAVDQLMRGSRRR